MANREHLRRLQLGSSVWNRWRKQRWKARPELRDDYYEDDYEELIKDFLEDELYEAGLSDLDVSRNDLYAADINGPDLSGADLRMANLSGVDLSGTDLSGADLSEADLRESDLSGTDLCRTNLSRANLSDADLREAKFSDADLSGANLSGADLSGAILIRTNLTNAKLKECTIYGISVWDVQLNGAEQLDLTITPEDQPTITVDNLKIAQFIYLLLNNAELREVIDTFTSQVVLILGRFPNKRKMFLEALRGELRNQNYLPVAFNFEETDARDFAEIVRTLANMAHFVLLDLTDLGDIVHEIADTIVPRCVVPIQPLLLQGSHRQEYELFRELQHKHRWVLTPYRYRDLSDLHTSFQEKILQPINEKIIELKQKKPLKIFIGYAPEDKNTLNTLKTHLRPLERAGLIEVWDDQNVAPGEEKGKVIEKHLSDARIILLLVSPAFLSSHDCYDIQMSMALERYEQGDAIVIPLLLRPCAWQSTPLKELQPLPKDGKPISKHNKDDVFFEVSEEIGDMIKTLGYAFPLYSRRSFQ